MSKNSSQAPIASVCARLNDFPNITMGTKASEYRLETLRQPLHLMPANPVHSFLSTNQLCTWFSGVEMSIATQANNIRFQTIKDAVIHVVVALNRTEIFRSKSTTPVDIKPQKSISHVFKATAPVSGDLLVRTTLKGNFNSQPFEVVSNLVIKIIPSFNIQTRTSSSQIVEVKMRNDLPIGASNITLSGANGEKMFVTDRMEPGNVYCGIIKMVGVSKDVTINFDLPFANNCVQKASIALAPSEAHYPIDFEFLDVPQSYKCFKPFNSTIKITNREKVALSGKAEFQTEGQGIYPFGATQFEISNLEPGKSIEIPVQFVGMIPGEQNIPTISFTISPLPPFKISPSYGVILIGTGDLD